MFSRIGDDARICLGYALLVASEYMCLHSPTAFATVELPWREIWIYYLIAVVAIQLLVFVAALFIRHSLPIRSRQMLILIASIVMVVGIAGIVLADRLGTVAGTPPDSVVLLIGVCLGIGFAVFSLCWARIFSRFDSKRLYRLVIVSYLIGLVVYLPVTLIPHSAIVPVIICVVLLSAFLLSSANAEVTLHTVSADQAVSGEVEKPEGTSKSIKYAVQQLWRPALCTAVFSFMSGLILAISDRVSLPLGEFQQVSIIASLIVVAILLLPALILSRPLDITSAYRVSLPISALGFLLLPFIFDALSGITIALVNMGLMTVSIILWCMLAATTQATRLPAHLVFGACMAVTTLANLAGIVLGLLQGVFLTQSFLSLAAVALVSIYLLSMLSLVVFKRPQSTGRASTDDEAIKALAYSEEQYLENCRQLAQDAGLTPREEEMLPLLGSGRSLTRVAGTLFISTNTAKSHVKSIYRKFNVHSKQELMDVVNEKASQQSSEI